MVKAGCHNYTSHLAVIITSQPCKSERLFSLVFSFILSSALFEREGELIGKTDGVSTFLVGKSNNVARDDFFPHI